MEKLSQIQTIAIMAAPFVFAIVFHEAAHGWIANRLGDPTAKDMGRLTLNPIPHIDLWGTVLMPLMFFLLGGMMFGYAKPVPINPMNFRHPKRDMAISSLAGPATNMIMAILYSVILRVAIVPLEGAIPEPYWSWIFVPLSYMCMFGVLINVVLAVLNLLPIPPLDGSRIVFWLLPDRQGMMYYRLEPYGIIILLALFAFGIYGKIMTPVIRPLLGLLLGNGGF
jgi:Zn-dependent protease